MTFMPCLWSGRAMDSRQGPYPRIHTDDKYGNMLSKAPMTIPTGYMEQIGQGYSSMMSQGGQFTSWEGQGHEVSSLPSDADRDTFACALCLVSCQGRAGLKQHVLYHHGSQYTQICFECGGRLFKSYQGYKKHEKVFHRGGADCKTCQVCGRTFPNESSLKQHLQKHTDVRPFACDNCGKAYKFSTSLKQHICQQVKPNTTDN